MRETGRIMLALCAMLAFGLRASAQAPMDTVYISTLYTTHIVFSTDITYADVSNLTDIAARIVEQNKNMLAIRARNEFRTTASVTALESNGVIHTYIIAYKEKPRQLVMDTRGQDAQPEYRMVSRQAAAVPAPAPQVQAPSSSAAPGPEPATPEKPARQRKERVQAQSAQPSAAPAQDGSFVSNLRKQDAPLLKDVIDYPQELFHISSRFQRVEVTCENIFAYSDITYVTLRLKNNSGVSYETENAMFVILDNNKQKRKIKPEPRVLLPKNRYGTLTAAPGETVKITYSFEKVTLSNDQILDIYIYEKGGSRDLMLTLSNQDVNLASVPQTR